MIKLHHHIAIWLVLGSLLLASYNGLAQVFAPSYPTVARTDTTEAQEIPSTLEAKKSQAAADSAKRTEHLFKAFGYKGIRLTRPNKAALLAAIFPGAGQIYNQTWWKLPLVYGALGSVVYGEYFFQKGYREFADATNLVAVDPTKIHDASLGPRASKFNSKAALDTGVNYYRGYRDTFYLYIGLAYGLQIVDALVDAHLKNFDVSDDLSFYWKPTLLIVPSQTAMPPTLGLLLALRVR